MGSLWLQFCVSRQSLNFLKKGTWPSLLSLLNQPQDIHYCLFDLQEKLCVHTQPSQGHYTLPQVPLTLHQGNSSSFGKAKYDVTDLIELPFHPLEHRTSRTNRSTVTVQYKDRHTHILKYIHTHTYMHAHTCMSAFTCTHIHTHMSIHAHTTNKTHTQKRCNKKCWKTKEKSSKQQRPLSYHTGKTWGGPAATFHQRDGSVERKEMLTNMIMLISKKIFCELFFCEN